MESKKTGYLILTLFGLLVLILTGYQAWQTLNFRSKAIQADGTIVGDRVGVGGKNTTYKYSLSYISGEGKTDTAQVHTKMFYLKPGEKIQFYYDPAAPKWGVLDVSVFNNFLGIIIGLLLVLWGFPKYRFEMKNERARAQHKEY